MLAQPGRCGGERTGLRDRRGDHQLAFVLERKRLRERDERVDRIEVEKCDDHRVAGGAVPGSRRSLTAQRRILAQDRLLELLERRARLQAELLHEPRSGRPVDLERLGLAPAAVERQHAQRVKTLAQRVLSGQSLELADELGLPRAR